MPSTSAAKKVLLEQKLATCLEEKASYDQMVAKIAARRAMTSEQKAAKIEASKKALASRLTQKGFGADLYCADFEFDRWNGNETYWTANSTSGV